ncbi:MAG: hypothetical protein AB8G05_28425 [Oligoflexales bacterium]
MTNAGLVRTLVSDSQGNEKQLADSLSDIIDENKELPLDPGEYIFVIRGKY